MKIGIMFFLSRKTYFQIQPKITVKYRWFVILFEVFFKFSYDIFWLETGSLLKIKVHEEKYITTL